MIAARLTSQLLAGDAASDPATVTGQLLAIQAQDPRGARLAIRARSRGLSWLHALTTPQLLTGNSRRLAQEGITPAAAERGVAVIARSPRPPT